MSFKMPRLQTGAWIFVSSKGVCGGWQRFWGALRDDAKGEQNFFKESKGADIFSKEGRANFHGGRQNSFFFFGSKRRAGQILLHRSTGEQEFSFLEYSE